MLEHRISKQLPDLADDEPTRKKMFGGDGSIATFSGKIEMAYALGIIDKYCRKKIDLIREIRIACAHSRRPLSMKRPALRDTCEVVMADFISEIKDKEPTTLRNAFVAKRMFVSHYIGTCEKIEGIAAQMKHLAKLLCEQVEQAGGK